MGKLARKLGHSFMQQLRFRSIQFTITVSFTLITVTALLFLGVVLYNKFSQTAEQNARLNTQQIIEQVQYNLEYYLDGMADVFEQVDRQVRTAEVLPSPALSSILETILGTRQDVVSMGLFTTDGKPVMSLFTTEMRENPMLTQQNWFRSALENPNHLSFSAPHVQNMYKGDYRWVVSMSKGVTILQGGKPVQAVLLLDVNFKTIDHLCQQVGLGKKGYAYIIDESSGNLIYHPQQQLIYVGLKYENVEQALKFTYGSYVDRNEGEQRLITVRTISNVGWKIIGVSYLDEVMTTKREINGFLIWLLAFVMISVILVSIFMSSKISQPIQRLKKSMEKVERGDFDTYIQVKGVDEVEQLSRRFNLMVSRIRELMDQIILEQEAKRKYEMEVLQAQINPHFLYNTLNSAVRMVGNGKNEDVITTITSLSKLFRISLSRGKTIITVEEELEHIRNYLIIQKMRFKDKFQYEVKAEEHILNCKTVKLVLQPIVENAIHHGIELMADPGFIRIEVFQDRPTNKDKDQDQEQGILVMRVSDNGIGMSPEAVQRLQQTVTGWAAGGLAASSGIDYPGTGARILENGGPVGGSGSAGNYSPSSGGSGVGLRNVHDRIKLYFGEEYGLHIESELEEGTTITIRMPLVREEPT